MLGARLSQPPSKIGFQVGGEMTVDIALKMLIVKSANDVAVMLAEGIGGAKPAFVERMNETRQADRHERRRTSSMPTACPTSSR